MDRINLEKKVSEFQKYKSILKKDTEFVKHYEEHFIVKYTYDSTAIEGNSLTIDETQELLMNNRTPAGKDLREVYEQINHKNAFEYLAIQLANGKELNEDIILATHKLIVQNIFQGGVYRDGQVYIRGSKHECPPPERVPELMHDFYEKLAEKNRICGLPESNVDVIELACWTHLEFVSIHPFRDGNGRTSRLLMNYQLMKNGYAPISIPVEKRKEYIDALEEFHTTGNAESFKEMICQLEEKELDYLIEHQRELGRCMDMELEQI